MVVALEVQHPVHDQMCVVSQQFQTLRLRFVTNDRCAKDDVAGQRALIRVGERENIRCVVLAAELAVEAPAFGLSHNAHRDGCVLEQCCRRPAAELLLRREPCCAESVLNTECKSGPRG